MRAPQPAPQVSKSKALITLSCLAAFLVAIAAAAVPELHRHLHADAAQAEHECAITIVQSGVTLADASPAISAPPRAVPFLAAAPLHPVWVPPLFSTARVFEHAPPPLS